LIAAVASVRTAADESGRARLQEIGERLENARSDRALNRVRQALRTEFAGYAAGRPTFGSDLGAIEATPGTYRVTLTVGDLVHTETLEVRQDPLGR
jgi:hypothetical protein